MINKKIKPWSNTDACTRATNFSGIRSPKIRTNLISHLCTSKKRGIRIIDIGINFMAIPSSTQPSRDSDNPVKR